MFGVGCQRKVEPRGCHNRRSRHPRLCGGVVVSAPTAPAPFPVVRPSDLRTSAASSAPWLIDQLWTASAVGIAGPSPRAPSGVLGHSCHHRGFSTPGSYGRSRAARSHPHASPPGSSHSRPLGPPSCHRRKRGRRDRRIARLPPPAPTQDRRSHCSCPPCAQERLGHWGRRLQSAWFLRSLCVGRFVPLLAPPSRPTPAFGRTPLRL